MAHWQQNLYPSPPTENARRASEAQARYKQRLEAIRQDARLSDHARREDITEAYRAVQEKVDGYREADRSDFEARRIELERRAFGLGSPNLTHGIDAVSARDASDRAAKIPITGGDEALELMERARLNGDAVLEKAVAAEAYRKGWVKVIDEYASTHPEFVPQLAELQAIRTLPTDLSYVSWFYLTPPPENDARLVGVRAAGADASPAATGWDHVPPVW